MSNLRCCHCLSRNTEIHCNQQQMTMRCSTGISHMEDSPKLCRHRTQVAQTAHPRTDRIDRKSQVRGRKSAGLTEVAIANRHERCVRLELIPVRDGSNVVLTLEIATLFSADLLPFHTQIVLEINRIGNVPAIQSAGHRRIHIPIRAFAMRGETL